MEKERTIGIVGLGLIGGSMAVDLRARGYASRVVGTDRNPLNAEAACRLGLVDATVSLEECIDRSDIIVVSVPVSAAAGIIQTVLDTFIHSSEFSFLHSPTITSIHDQWKTHSLD